MAGQFGLDNIASLYDPSVAVDQLSLQRRMAIAQALRQQAMTPVDTAGRQIGGMGYAVSPMEGIAKIVQALSAQHLEGKTDEDRLALSQKMAMALRGALDDQPQQAPATPAAPPADPNGGLPAGVTPQAMTAGGFPQPAPQPVPQPQPAQPAPANRMTLASLVRGGMINDIGGGPMGAAYAKNFEPTDMERNLRAAGIDPNSTLGHQLVQQNIAKQNYIAPVSGRPGGYLQDANGNIKNLPKVPDGFAAVPNPNSPTGFDIVPQPGGVGAVELGAAAAARGQGTGKAQTTQAPVQYDANGNPKPTTTEANVLGLNVPPGVGVTPSGNIPPGVQTQRDDVRRKALADELRKTTDPTDRAAITKELDNTRNDTAYPTTGANYPAPPLGTENAQKGLDVSWEALKSANREAQTTSSYLDGIVQAAHKGAIVGPNADRREMIQGFFQLAGIKEAVNENAVTQTQLLDKYHNQIVSRLRANGLSTDAAQAAVDSAFPGKPMNIGAIDEAAANLKGAQAMVKAKTSFLLQPATKRDTATYQQREVQFDQNADPRIWQWASIQDPNARKAFLAQTLQQDPGFLDRVKTLKSMGAIQ